jgi:predicted SAM-dependent methyltransferase
LKELLRRSAFIVALVRTVRAGLRDLRVCYWVLLRRSRIRAHLRGRDLRRLHLGASGNVMTGWLNTDLTPASADVVYLDVTRRFPFEDQTFDYVFSEHVIEHVEYEKAVFMLRECFRVLKPHGRIRVATPDLRVLIGLYGSAGAGQAGYYVDWIIRRMMPGVEKCKEVFVINNAFHAWGHQFLYDCQTLAEAMRDSGFADVTPYRPGISGDENLQGLEAHGAVILSERINDYETLVLEARA